MVTFPWNGPPAFSRCIAWSADSNPATTGCSWYPARVCPPSGQRARLRIAGGQPRDARARPPRLPPERARFSSASSNIKSNKEIGNQLHLSERTIKFHMSSLLAKFGARDRVDLMCKAAVGLLPSSAAPTDSSVRIPGAGSYSRTGKKKSTSPTSKPRDTSQVSSGKLNVKQVQGFRPRRRTAPPCLRELCLLDFGSETRRLL